MPHSTIQLFNGGGWPVGVCRRMRFFLTAALCVAAAAAATSACNPLSTACSPNPALATSVVEDFSSSPADFAVILVPSGILYSDDGAAFTIKQRFDNPGIKSKWYIMFGRVEVHMKAAKGQGVVSSFYLQLDDLDEIDIELFGTDTTQFQSNFFSKGDTTKYDRGVYSSTPLAPQELYLNYTLVWTQDKLEWWLEGTLTRTLASDSPLGYPQTPMFVAMGIWAGGDALNEPGTIEWAGGDTTYDQDYSMYVKKLVVDDYLTGESYAYGDRLGSWKLIEAKGGEVNGRVGERVSASASASVSASSSASSSLSSLSLSSLSLSLSSLSLKSPSLTGLSLSSLSLSSLSLSSLSPSLTGLSLSLSSLSLSLSNFVLSSAPSSTPRSSAAASSANSASTAPLSSARGGSGSGSNTGGNGPSASSASGTGSGTRPSSANGAARRPVLTLLPLALAYIF